MPLRALSAQFAELARVDAAFVDAAGAEWLVGRDRIGRLARVPQGARAARGGSPTPRTWGTIRNNFADPERIDTAFRDAEGKTYLFAGDQYVRYSGDDYAPGRRGLPPDDRRELGRPRDCTRALPPGFETSVDASFHGLDGRTYLFTGGRYAASGEPGGADRSAERWGRVRNAFADAGRDRRRLRRRAGALSSCWATRSSATPTASRTAASGSTRATRGAWSSTSRTCPRSSRAGIEAAFAEPGRRACTCSRTAARSAPRPATGSSGGSTSAGASSARCCPPGTVDAAFVGLDGKTYLFSGDRYLRYSGADYSHVDARLPAAGSPATGAG